ncbi:MAG TPA: helix-turn-helix transcriptional regulator [Anaerolineales bacterium]
MPPTARFTKQETKVIELLLQGKSNKQIAAQLGIQVRTAEFHLKNIYAKLNVASRTEAVLKLAGESPRESTGLAPEAAYQRISTVAKADEMVKNRRNPVRAWVRDMPIILYVLIAAALVLVLLGLSGVFSGVFQGPVAVASAGATGVMPISTVTLTPTPALMPTSSAAPTASPIPAAASPSPAPTGDSCSGPMAASPAGPKINVTLVNDTQGKTTVSIYLAKNRFGDCGYRSYELTWGESLPLKEVLPYGCYSLYALINDPNNPTHVTNGPVCITNPDPLVFRITYSKLSVSPGP